MTTDPTPFLVRTKTGTFDLEATVDRIVPDVSADRKHELARLTYDELELRVGSALSQGLTDEQLTEFEKLTDAGDEDGSSAWLAANRPDYREVVNRCMLVLFAEIVDRVGAPTPSGDPRSHAR